MVRRSDMVPPLSLELGFHCTPMPIVQLHHYPPCMYQRIMTSCHHHHHHLRVEPVGLLAWVFDVHVVRSCIIAIVPAKRVIGLCTRMNAKLFNNTNKKSWSNSNMKNRRRRRRRCHYLWNFYPLPMDELVSTIWAIHAL
jgi:hypothetical protein